MEIGLTIRCRRLELGMTQSQLAEKVHVSAQAISKWETGMGLPDISQIVPLAKALDMTTDKLLSSGEPDASLERRWQDALRYYGYDSEKLLKVSVDILKDHPNHPSFLFRAAVDEHYLARKLSNDMVHLRRAQYYGERLISLYPAHEEGKEILVGIYADLGERERAIAMAYQCSNTDRALKTCLTGDELRQHRQKIIDRKAESLLGVFMVAEEEMLNQAEAMLNVLYPGERHSLYNRIGLLRARIAADKGEKDAAREILRDLLDAAPPNDRIPLQQVIGREFTELSL